MRKECKEVVGNEKVTAQGLANLKYTTAAIKESLRIFAPATVMVKQALKEDRMGEYVIPKGQHVVIPISVLHNLDSNWPDQGKFLPERFLSEGIFSISTKC